MTHRQYHNKRADPLYIRFIAERVASGSLLLDEPCTVPVTLDAEFDRIWLALPRDHDFLLHRILGVLALLREPATDEMIVSILGNGSVYPDEVVELRRPLAPWLIFTDYCYTLSHDRLRTYLVGDLCNLRLPEISLLEERQFRFGKFRPSDICRLHELIIGHYDNTSPSKLHLMTDSGFRNLSWHLAQISALNYLFPDLENRTSMAHDRLYALLQNEDYREAAIKRVGHQAVAGELFTGIADYAGYQGKYVSDDARLCWLSLRLGRLGADARIPVATLFEELEADPAYVSYQLEDAIQTMEALEGGEYIDAVFLLLLVEVEFQQQQPKGQHTTVGLELIIQELRKRVASGELEGKYRVLVRVILNSYQVFPQIHGEVRQLMMGHWDGESTCAFLECGLVQLPLEGVNWIPEPDVKAKITAQIAANYAQDGDHESAETYFRTAVELARSQAETEKIILTLCHIGKCLASVGKTDVASRLVDECTELMRKKTGIKRDDEIYALVTLLACTQKTQLALEYVTHTRDYMTIINSLVAIAEAVSTSGDPETADGYFEQAHQIIAECDERVPRIKGCEILLCGLIRRTRQELFDRVLNTATASRLFSWILKPVIQQLVLCRRMEEAAVLLDDESLDAGARSASLKVLSRGFAVAGDLKRACSLFASAQRAGRQSEINNTTLSVNQAFDQDVKKSAYEPLSKALTTIGLFREAKSVADKIPTAKNRIVSYAFISRGLTLAKETDMAEVVFQQAKQLCLDLLKNFQGPSQRLDVAKSILASSFAESFHFQEAIEMVNTIETDWSKSEALARIAPCLVEAENGSWGKAVTLARGIPEEWRRAQALADIAVVLIKRKRTDTALALLQEAMGLVFSLATGLQRNVSARFVALSLAQMGLMKEAIDFTSVMEEGVAKVHTLANIARIAVTRSDAEAFNEALRKFHLVDTSNFTSFDHQTWLISKMITEEEAWMKSDEFHPVYFYNMNHSPEFACALRKEMLTCNHLVTNRLRRTFLICPHRVKSCTDSVNRLLESLLYDKNMTAVSNIIVTCPELGLATLLSGVNKS